MIKMLLKMIVTFHSLLIISIFLSSNIQAQVVSTPNNCAGCKVPGVIPAYLPPCCGNGILDPGEACDDGNKNNADSCSNSCTGQCVNPDSCGRPCGNSYYGNVDCCVDVTPPQSSAVQYYWEPHSWYSSNTGWHGEWIASANICIKGRVTAQAAGSNGGSTYYNVFQNGQNITRSLLLQGAALSKAPLEGWYGIYSFSTKANSNGEVCYTCASMRIAGCFAPETKILMADGSEKEIQDISAGEMVRNPVSGQALAVESLIESFEENSLIEVTLSDRKLRITENHPVLTSRGIISANKLSKLDEVKTLDGKFHKVSDIKVLEKKSKQRVLNLKLKTDSKDFDSHMVLADGIVTGDHFVQERFAK